jgi:hypothetical protein
LIFIYRVIQNIRKPVVKHPKVHALNFYLYIRAHPNTLTLDKNVKKTSFLVVMSIFQDGREVVWQILLRVELSALQFFQVRASKRVNTIIYILLGINIADLVQIPSKRLVLGDESPLHIDLKASNFHDSL